MTYAASKPEKDLAQLALRMDMGDRELLTGDVVCPGQWVLQAALRRTEAGELFALGGKPLRTAPGEPAWKIRCVTAPEAAAVGLPEELAEAMPADAPMLLRQSLSFRYGHEEATHAPSKQTATQRKGREKDAEAAENTQEPKVIHRSWRRPAFAEAEAGGAEFGNAMHACLQFIRYDACDSAEGVLREVERLVKAGLLTEEQGQLVDHRQIAAFFSSDLGKKLRCGGEVLREFKFSILDDGENYGAGLSGEKILLQGVVDCALLEEDGITVVDFKTDKVTEATLPEKVEHYRPQVLAYASALERIYGKPVKQMLLYFFQLGQFVQVD
jgi:ATP-dependent helicase/nuclease subunit A